MSEIRLVLEEIAEGRCIRTGRVRASQIFYHAAKLADLLDGLNRLIDLEPLE